MSSPFEAYKTIITKNNTISVFYEESPENPREEFDGNVAMFIFFHRCYAFHDDGLDGYNQSMFDSWDELRAQLDTDYPSSFIFPVYMYEHGGIALSVSQYSDKWDSGQLGFAVVTQERLNEFGLKEMAEERILEMIKEELQAYEDYLNGRVFRVIIDDSEGDMICSVGGFYGDDFVKNGLLECIAGEGLDEDEVEQIKRELR